MDPDLYQKGEKGAELLSKAIQLFVWAAVVSVVLKAFGVIAWAWVWVFAPFWLPVSIIIFLGNTLYRLGRSTLKR